VEHPLQDRNDRESPTGIRADRGAEMERCQGPLTES
jgi:hypothetical protein